MIEKLENKDRAEKSYVLSPNFMDMIMSSTNRKSVQLPDSVDVLIQDNECIKVKGQKGELRLNLITEVDVNIDERSLNLSLIHI